MNELVQALNEMDGSGSNKLQIEHLFLMGSTKSIDKAIKRLTDGLLDLSRTVMECLQIVSVGAAVCLILVGTAQVIRAIRGDGSENSPTRKNKRERKGRRGITSEGSSVDDDEDPGDAAAT